MAEKNHKKKSGIIWKIRLCMFAVFFVYAAAAGSGQVRAAGSAKYKSEAVKQTSKSAKQPVKVKLNKSSLLLRTNETERLTLKNAPGKVTWTSTKRSVAAVSSDGKVKAKKSGSCTIIARSGGKQYTCTVRVCAGARNYKHYLLQKIYKVQTNQKKILIAGSSSIRHWTSAGDAFYPYEVINMGIGGSTTKMWLKWYKDLIVDYHPSVIVLYPGAGNELGAGWSVEETTEDVCSLLKKLHQELPDVPIYYISVFRNIKQKKLWPQENKCNQKVKKFCSSMDNIHYIDVAEPLASGNNPKQGTIGSDKVHLSNLGYSIWNRTIVPVVKAKLQQIYRKQYLTYFIQ